MTRAKRIPKTKGRAESPRPQPNNGQPFTPDHLAALHPHTIPRDKLHAVWRAIAETDRRWGRVETQVGRTLADLAWPFVAVGRAWRGMRSRPDVVGGAGAIPVVAVVQDINESEIEEARRTR